jgi:hypothetical protein
MNGSAATEFAGCTRASNIHWPDALQPGEQMNRQSVRQQLVGAQPDGKKAVNAYLVPSLGW